MSKRTDIRMITMQTILIGAAVLLVLRMGYLQILDESSQVKAEATTINTEVIKPARGLIYDRQDRLLVHNAPSYNLMLTHKNLDPNMDHELFKDLLDIQDSVYASLINKDWNDVRYDKNVPYVFLSKIPAHRFLPFLEYLHQFPGFNYEIRDIRGYHYPSAAHVLGYMSEVNPDILEVEEGKTIAEKNYSKGDYYGVSGIEKMYERNLKGQRGIEYQLKDNFGRTVGAYERGFLNQTAASGTNVQIGIDIELQQYAETLMLDKKGAVVAIEPTSGEILTLVSSPSYNPAKLSITNERDAAFRSLAADSTQPFFNRAIMAQYPPGSTIKPILALIGMQEGIVAPSRVIRCNGGYFYKIYKWGCHAGPGVRNTEQAIMKSCNTFFYTIYRELIDKYGWSNPEKGLSHLNTYFTSMGLGGISGIDLPEESSGLIPDPAFYDRLYEGKGDWRSTYIISNGIGQGEVELTTLQMANLATILANRGYYITPHLIKGFSDPDIELPKYYKQQRNTNIDAAHFEPVLDGMEKSIGFGTGNLAAVPGIKICGKTGTSENSHGKDHSVFYAFAPRDNPKIAIAVYVENAGWGSTVAAPIAGLIMEKYLKGNIDPRRFWLENFVNQTKLLANN